MSSTQLGRVQLLIMQVLWQLGKATAREITDALNESDDIAHSTVQTLLRGLEEKGSITHAVEGRTFVFRPLVDEEKFKQRATSDLLQRVFGGDAATLVAHLLKEKSVSRKEIDDIRKLIDRRGKK
ncbi:BlaI/MecI/CopY family transcriptional regulator [Aeoliella sp.]|uniref:BlaI/MecI/CopY family transcriptional regulator n=1 Tax=Aeoliella sp. TaxID=2795800 RepID=UPI003CCBF5D4